MTAYKNPTEKIEKAFILAAGKGVRMRPLTDTCPKPLLSVAGQPIIGHVLDALKSAGIHDVVINLNYLGEQLEDYLRTRTDFNVTLSWEDELLETGGGVKKTLHHFHDQPFFVLNGDVIWQGGSIPALQRLYHAYDPQTMDALLLLQPQDRQVGFDGLGDYDQNVKTLQITRRRTEDHNPPYIFAGPRIIHPRLFDQSPEGAFSFLTLFDQAEAAGRLAGVVHDGEWYHIGTPDALKEAEDLILAKQPPLAKHIES